MMNPLWMILSLVTLVAGTLVILAPNFIVSSNKRLSKVLFSTDDLVMRHRHAVGVLLFIVAYLCFRLALLVASGL